MSTCVLSHSVMFDSFRPHGLYPARLLCSWDSAGKNAGVGCHFLLQCMKVKSESEVAQSCPTLRYPMGLQPTKLLRSWDSPGKSTGVGCHCLLQIAIARTSKSFLNNSSKSGLSCLIPDPKGKAFSFSPLRIMLAVGLSYMGFIMLR